MARLNDMVHRILRTDYALGIWDNQPKPRPINPFPGAEVAQRVAEQGRSCCSRTTTASCPWMLPPSNPSR